MKGILKVFYGVLTRLLNAFVPVKKGCWVFGSDFGEMYREGSKYLLEYMLQHHPDYDCCFIASTKEVCRSLRRRGIPCAHNFSLKGVWAIVRAECVFTTQSATDVLFVFKKKGQRYFYLTHGMPMKVALGVLRKRDGWDVETPRSFAERVMSAFSRLLVLDFKITDSEFVSATSEFFKRWMEPEFDNRTPVKVLGMPRNDALFQPGRMEREAWIDGCEGKFIISYMPTHRLYGRGEVAPSPFANRPDVQEWMSQNGVVLVVKNHPNMLRQFPNGYSPYESTCIRDITASQIDPMTVVYRSDVMITDYSSVWMDYLLLKRPLIFYIFDDFVHDDVGVYYDIKEEHIGHFCYSEDELFELIKKTKSDYDSMRPKDEVVQKFHRYVDGNSCERYFNAITKNCLVCKNDGSGA